LIWSCVPALILKLGCYRDDPRVLAYAKKPLQQDYFPACEAVMAAVYANWTTFPGICDIPLFGDFLAGYEADVGSKYVQRVLKRNPYKIAGSAGTIMPKHVGVFDMYLPGVHEDGTRWVTNIDRQHSMSCLSELLEISPSILQETCDMLRYNKYCYYVSPVFMKLAIRWYA